MPRDLFALPAEQPPVLSHAPLLRLLQTERPITRVRTPAGDEAWLVTRHAEVTQLFTDRRIGRTHPDPERAPRIVDHAMLGPTHLYEHETEHDEHLQMRALLTPHFSAKRMRANLVAHKRDRPGDDVISGLCKIDELPDEAIAGLLPSCCSPATTASRMRSIWAPCCYWPMWTNVMRSFVTRGW